LIYTLLQVFNTQRINELYELQLLEILSRHVLKISIGNIWSVSAL